LHAKRKPMAKNKSKKSSPKKHKSISSLDRTHWYAAIGIFLFAFLLYANTIDHGFVLDDDLVCKKNAFVQAGIGGIKDIFTHSWYYGFSGTTDRYYRPMMLAGFAIEKQLFGNSPSFYHFFNVFEYALGCVFLFFTMRLLFEKKFFLPILAATLLFAAHPLHTEVVANIKSRDEIYAFLGMLGVIYAIVQYHRKGNIIYFIIALLSYFFAILSKEGALSILGLVPLVLYFFTKTSLSKIVWQTFYFGLIAGIYFFIRGQVIDPNPTPFETIDNSLFAIDNFWGQRATAIGMLGKYFQLLVFPHPLSFDYSYNTFPESGWTDTKVLASLAVSIGLILLAIKGLHKRSIYSFTILFFAITFAITSNIFFSIGATFAERFMFIPLLGFCVTVVFLLNHFFLESRNYSPNTFIGITGIILLLYSTKTITRNTVWESDDTLYETGIITAPNSSRTQSFYGVTQYRKALAETNLAKKKELLKVAVEYLKKSIEIYPGFTETYHHLALVYEAQNNNPLAIEAYKTAIKTNAAYFPAMTNLGVLFYKLKNYNQAENYLKQSLLIAPNNVITNRSLGLIYKATNRFKEAEIHFKNALDAQYNDTHLFDLVELYKAMGDLETAVFYDKKIKEFRNSSTPKER
jgi:tetratricopeptide (TPR) repeat protein